MNAPETDLNAVLELERRAREAAEAKDLERYVSFYADDAALFWPGAPMVKGRACPALRGVAAGTVLAELPGVAVVVLVACDARRSRPLKLAASVALQAGKQGVSPLEEAIDAAVVHHHARLAG